MLQFFLRKEMRQEQFVPVGSLTSEYPAFPDADEEWLNMRELLARRELTAQLKVSEESLMQANQKLELLSAQLEQTRLQNLADEHELLKRCELDTLKNEYVAMVSHELKSPLTSVRGAVGILSAGLVGPATEKGARLFSIALTNLDRVIRLINDVLNLERIASGASSLHMEQCSIENLVKQAIDTMVPIAQDLNVRLVADAIAGLPEATIFINADPDKIVQVLINLLSNALKFSPSGAEVVVGIEASDDTLTVRISDAGRGIPEDQLKKVFERFQQVEQDDARRLGGTGLGLAICRSIVEQHGGSIWAERNVGKGTSFLVKMLRSPRLP